MSIATRLLPETANAPSAADCDSSVVHLAIPANVLLKSTPEDFGKLAAANREMRLELTASGELIVMAPEGSWTGHRNFHVVGQLFRWIVTHGGIGFGSSAGFTLHDKSIRSPDAAWIAADRWNALPDADKQGFARICPDFVVELRSASDPLDTLQAKMADYARNGVRLGWLIDPESRTVFVYRPDHEPVRWDNPATVSGEDVLPGFALDLAPVFA